MTDMKKRKSEKWKEAFLSYLNTQERELAKRKPIEKSIKANRRVEMMIIEVKTWYGFQ